LVAACVAGDEAAWERFYTSYQPLVLRAARRACSRWGLDDADGFAHDVAAEVFAHLLADDRRALSRFEGRSKITTWLAVVTRRRAGRLLRRKRPDTIAEPDELHAGGPSPSEVAQVSERQQIVRRQLQTLSDRDRLALQLFYEGGKSYREVAAALDLPENRVGTLLARARERLAKALGKKL
jgi:RNA polymerase sigma-70 factor (ECF subfamily)